MANNCREYSATSDGRRRLYVVVFRDRRVGKNRQGTAWACNWGDAVSLVKENIIALHAMWIVMRKEDNGKMRVAMKADDWESAKDMKAKQPTKKRDNRLPF